MTEALAALLLAVSLAGWVLLSLLPALGELRRARDAQPLRIVQGYDRDVRHFANRLRELAEGILRGDTPAGDTPAAYVVDGHNPDSIPQALRQAQRTGEWTAITATAKPPGPESIGRAPVIISPGDVALPGHMVLLADLYARGDCTARGVTTLRAMLATGDITLDASCTVLRWIHADGSLSAGEGCVLYGRASANVAMRLGVGCLFDRIYAPVIRCGENASVPHEPPAPPAAPFDIPAGAQAVAGRVTIPGNFRIPRGVRLHGDYIATGDLEVEDDVQVAGSLKARRDVMLARGVHVAGGVVAERDLLVGTDCRVAGPLIANREVRVGRGTVVGEPSELTSITAEAIKLAPGVVVHGSAWARRGGEVTADVGSVASASPA